MEKCIEDGCVLSAWHPPVGMPTRCLFHYQYNQKEIFLSRYLDYATNPEFPPHSMPNLLVIRGVEIPVQMMGNLCQVLRDGFRPLIFDHCVFSDISIFSNIVYKNEITYDHCVVNSEESQQPAPMRQWVFNRCTFERNISVIGDLAKVLFVECKFFGSCKSYLTAYSESPAPKTTIRDSSFNGRSDVGLSHCVCDNKLKLENVTCEARMSLGEATADVEISDLTLNDHTSIALRPSQPLNDENKLILKGCKAYGDLLIKASYTEPWKALTAEEEDHHSIYQLQPRIVIRDLDRFAGARVSFHHLNIGRYEIEESNFLFHNVVLDDVTFADVGDRKGFICEREAEVNTRLLLRLKECYKNLKLSYDSQSDYSGGNNFHVGEMWAQWKIRCLEVSWLLRRFFVRKDCIVLTNRRSCNFYFYQINKWSYGHTWYYWLSRFGQSALRPASLIFKAFLFSSVAYFFLLFLDGWVMQSPTLSCGSQIFRSLENAFWNLAVWYRPEFKHINTPSNFWLALFGKAVSFVQYSFSLIAGAFFLLALRRRFKR